LLYGLVLDLWCFFLPTGLHMLISHSDLLGRHDILHSFSKWVEHLVNVFLVEIAIYHESTFLLGACHTCHCHVLNNIINTRFVGTPGSVAVPKLAPKLLIKGVITY
jgi:hypothetical protein